LGENDHHQPYIGDHGVQFEPATNFVAVQRAAPSPILYRRVKVRPLRPEIQIISRLLQNPQIPEEIAAIIKTEYATIESKLVKGKHNKKSLLS